MTNSVTVTALNIMDGLDHRTHWDKLQPMWDAQGWGFLEFCGWIADVAAMVEEELSWRDDQDFPGVFDYEVSYPLGEQILNHLTRKDSTGFPDDDTLQHWVKVLVDQFFEQGHQ